VRKDSVARGLSNSSPPIAHLDFDSYDILYDRLPSSAQRIRGSLPCCDSRLNKLSQRPLNEVQATPKPTRDCLGCCPLCQLEIGQQGAYLWIHLGQARNLLIERRYQNVGSPSSQGEGAKHKNEVLPPSRENDRKMRFHCPLQFGFRAI
jgi:hypothetical protein